jgi:hypothetical protein
LEVDDEEMGPVTGLHCGGDDLIVIDIAGHDPRYGGECDQFGDLDVVGKQVAAWFRDTAAFSQPARAS